jgi:hypothetical protein
VSFGGIVPDAVSGCNVSVWRPRTRAVVPVGFQVPRGCLTVGSSASTTFSLAFAGGRTAWVERYGGIGIYLQLVGASVSHPFPSFLGSASGCCSGGNPFDGQHVGDIVGSGGLLVFGTWTTACALQPCPGLAPIRGQTIWRIAGGPGRCPGAAFELGNMHCVEVAGSAGALAPLDVDAGRIVAARSDGSLELLDA